MFIHLQKILHYLYHSEWGLIDILVTLCHDLIRYFSMCAISASIVDLKFFIFFHEKKNIHLKKKYLKNHFNDLKKKSLFFSPSLPLIVLPFILFFISPFHFFFSFAFVLFILFFYPCPSLFSGLQRNAFCFCFLSLVSFFSVCHYLNRSLNGMHLSCSW